MKTARKRHILEEHYLDFYSRAVDILNDEDDAKDAVQEAVVKTLVRVGVRDMVAYCFRATEHECVNMLRRRLRLSRFDEQALPDAKEEHRLHAELKESKALLSPMERRVYELRREHGYTIAETSGQTGVSPTTVKRLLAVAEQKIKYNMTHEI